MITLIFLSLSQRQWSKQTYNSDIDLGNQANYPINARFHVAKNILYIYIMFSTEGN